MWQSIGRQGAGARVLAGLVVVLAATAARAASVNRCEAPDRSVTYSNEACPPGTRLVRTFEPQPPVLLGDGKDARPAAPLGGRPADGKGPDGKGPADGKAAPAGNRVERSTKPAARPTPDEAREAADEKRRQRIAECDDLVRRIDFAQRDLAAATPADRASAELALRRLQQQHGETCTPRK